MKIEFVNCNKKIPMELRLKVDDKIHVTYAQSSSQKGLTYNFRVMFADTKEQAQEIIEKIVSIIESESYDHGSEWRHTDIDYCDHLAEYGDHIFQVAFRVKDSY